MHAAEMWHRKRALVVLFGEAGLLLSIFKWSLVSFTGCGLFLLHCCMFRLSISNYTKNHCQHHDYLTTKSFVRKSDQLEHVLRGLRVSAGSLAMLTSIGLMCAKLCPEVMYVQGGRWDCRIFWGRRKSRKVCGTNVPWIILTLVLAFQHRYNWICSNLYLGGGTELKTEDFQMPRVAAVPAAPGHRSELSCTKNRGCYNLFHSTCLAVYSLKYFIAACKNPDVRENGHLSVKAIDSAGKVTEKMQARTEVKRTQFFCWGRYKCLKMLGRAPHYR